MAPTTTNPHVVSQLRHLIYYHLDCNHLRNALFFAGRLQAYEFRSTEAAYLLALCHLRLGQLKAAYDVSRNAGSRGTHLGCAYVFAQACLGLEKYAEGASALERSKGLWSSRNSWGKHTDTRRQHLPDAAAVYCLEGKLLQAHANYQGAIECYAEALKINPMMWDAFTALCDLGAHVRPSNVFKISAEMRSFMTDTALEPTPFGVFDESSPNALIQSNANVNMQMQQCTNTDPFSISKNRLNGDVKTNAGTLALYEKLNSTNSINTPIPTTDIIVDDTPTIDRAKVDTSMTNAKSGLNEPPMAPTRKGRGVPGIGMDLSSDAPPKMRSNTTLRSKSRTRPASDDQEDTTHKTGQILDLKRTISGKTIHPASSVAKQPTSLPTEAPQRKSVRLLNQLRPQSGKFSGSAGSASLREEREVRKAKAPSTKFRGANSFNVGRAVSSNRKLEHAEVDNKEQRPPSSHTMAVQPINTRPVVDEKSKKLEALQWLFDLFQKLGSGYFALSHYQCHDAIRIFQSINTSQRETPWVLAQIGRAHYEQATYADAERVFNKIRVLAPSRAEDMEFFSTSLWHLKHDVDLAFLAHELIDLDRSSPQAWCAIGNSFSLQRDHDQALKCFKRATQLDPSFAYAYTLQGHEYVSNEEYDKAMLAYRASITAGARHYNAWYGLGRVYEKQGRYTVAEHHYRTAQSINPTNAVLVNCIGIMLEKQRNLKAALVKYDEACQLAPTGTLWRYRKAKVLVNLGQPDRALLELDVLKDIAPDDANVHFSLGGVYKRLGRKGDAIRHFTMALNLDPKSSHHIKEAMEELDNDSDEDIDM